jgi:hypothetical protein
MARKNGSMEFDSDNYLLFIVEGSEDEEDDSDKNSHMMEWQNTPAAMAKALRKAADWLDAHKGDNIRCNVD